MTSEKNFNKIVLKEIEARLSRLKQEAKLKESELSKIIKEVEGSHKTLAELQANIQSKETHLSELLKQQQEIEAYIKEFSIKEFVIEKPYNGPLISIHKKENSIKIFSESQEDITNEFDKDLLLEILKLSKEDMIVDAEFDEDKLQIDDVLYYTNPISDLPLRNRLVFLNKFNFTDRIINRPRKLTDRNTLKDDLKLMGERSIIKKLDAPYFNEPKILDPPIPFYPMESKKRFYQVDKAVAHMFKNGNKYALEGYNGFRIILMKYGDIIKIYSGQKEDITDKFNMIKGEAANLSNRDFIADADMTIKNYDSVDIMEFVKGKIKLDESEFNLLLSDVIHFKGEDITNTPWYERKSILHSLHFTEHIREANSIIVESIDKAMQALTFLNNLNGFDGIIIKPYDSGYVKNGVVDKWIKLEATTTSTTGISSIQAKKWQKKIEGVKR